jgi:hypothetical protein
MTSENLSAVLAESFKFSKYSVRGHRAQARSKSPTTNGAWHGLVGARRSIVSTRVRLTGRRAAVRFFCGFVFHQEVAELTNDRPIHEGTPFFIRAIWPLSTYLYMWPLH